MPGPEWLYRGVSREMHDQSNGRLKPKGITEFTYEFKWGESGLRWGDGGTWGGSEANAVLRHQLNQEGFPTSGISTTPSIRRAEFYALNDGRRPGGVIYRINTAELERFSVQAFRVADVVRRPSIPEDDEYILVPPLGDTLPTDLIAEVIRVGSAWRL